MAAAGEMQHYDQAAEQGDEQEGQPGEALVAEEADDQVEDQPDQDADREYQQAERAHGLEFVLAELGAQGGGRDLLAYVGFDGLEHRWAPEATTFSGLDLSRVNPLLQGPYGVGALWVYPRRGRPW
ncbi:hypothetical protein D3C72_1900760 [compost metagenome]